MPSPTSNGGVSPTARQAWTDAYESLSAADRVGAARARRTWSCSPPAAYMIGREDDYLDAAGARAPRPPRRRAELGAPCAARSGSASPSRRRGEMGRAGGWLGRAQRLLERTRGRVRRARLPAAAARSSSRRRGGDLEAAAAAAGEAAAIGERFGDSDLFALAAHEQGHILIQDGRLEEGLRAAGRGDGGGDRRRAVADRVRASSTAA